VRQFVLALMSLLTGMDVLAQALATQPARTMVVVQFGVPQDAKFIFCDGGNCPARSVKTLARTVHSDSEPTPRTLMQQTPAPTQVVPKMLR
jgi:hypothetical protein